MTDLVTKDQIAYWREVQGEGLESAIGEYTPPEFWNALDTIEQHEKAQQWTDISTAPKDGRWFLAKNSYNEIFKCRWVTAEILKSEHGGAIDDWRDGVWDDGENEACPSKWLPCTLPALNEDCGND